MMEKAQGRRAWIDCARGIAIILVVIGHYDQGSSLLCHWISSFHVTVFFVLSGILVALKDAYEGIPLKQILAHKAKQLLYPFLTFSMLVMAYYLLRGQPERAAQVLFYTVTLEGHNALWFLPSIWMAECMLLVLLRSRIADWLGTALLLAGTTIYAALQYYVIGGAIPAEEGMLFLIGNGLCRAGIGAVMMMAGYKGYQLAGRRIRKKGRWLVPLCCTGVGFICGMLNGMSGLHYCIQYNPILYYLAALLQTGGLIMLCAFVIKRNAVLEFFGRNSLIIMATHYALPPINIAHWMVRQMGIDGRYINLLLGCSLVLAMEAGIVAFINRCCPFMLRLPKKR